MVKVVQLGVGLDDMVNGLAVITIEERLIETGDVSLCMRIENLKYSREPDWDSIRVVG